jgi:hypothetical protein
MNKRMKIFLILAILIAGILLSSGLEAQEQETVYFKDGTIVTGRIIKLNPEKIRIEQEDGSIIVRSTRDIYKFSSGRSFRDIYFNAIEPGPDKDEKAEGGSKHSFTVAPVAYNLEYSESSITEEGLMYGINGNYEYRDRWVMVSFNLEYLFGNLDYNGNTWGGSPYSADTDDYLYEYRFLIGSDIYDKKYKITSFVGYGMRYWNDDISGSGGYEREVSYYYSPIGFKISKPLSKKWSGYFTAEYDLFWGGKVISHLSDTDSDLNDPENTQEAGKGHGMRVSLNLSNQLTDKVAWFIEPFFRYWDVSDSGCSTLTFNDIPVATVYEPSNKTKIFGLYIGISF